MRSQTAPDIVCPHLTVLTPDQVARVHEQSLALLSTTGIRVDGESARRLFRRVLGAGAEEAGRVRIPGELVDWALETAAHSVEIFSRSGAPAFKLPGPARFGIGVTALYYEEPATGEIVQFARRHMRDMVRLGNAMPGFDAVATVGVIQDVAPEVSDLVEVLEMAANTTKPLVVLVSDEGAYPKVLDLLEHLQGDLASRPFVLPYFNPISPLVINEGTIDKMWATVERGLPFIYSNYGMAGASTPILPGGTLVLLNAELLAGLVLGQLMKPGTPMILGSLPAYFDMRGKGSFYTPHSYTIDLACAEMMAHYGLPHCGTSGSGMGWGGDLIAAGHQWMNHLLSCMGRVGLAPFVGDNLGSIVFSPTIVVYANDIIAQARALAGGFPIDARSLALDEIADVGPGGNFLMSPQTLKHFRTAYFRSGVLPPMTLDDWQARGSRRAEDVLREHTARLLAQLAPPEDHGEVMTRGEAFIARL
jgi:trimethylamine--corrinoid protein Co-methyltransferase